MGTMTVYIADNLGSAAEINEDIIDTYAEALRIAQEYDLDIEQFQQ